MSTAQTQEPLLSPYLLAQLERLELVSSAEAQNRHGPHDGVTRCEPCARLRADELVQRAGGQPGGLELRADLVWSQARLLEPLADRLCRLRVREEPLNLLRAGYLSYGSSCGHGGKAESDE